VCITHYCDSEQLKVVLATPLREEMVERNLVLCEPLNEDVGFFVDPNLKIKFCISHVLLLLLTFLLIFTFLLSISCDRSLLFSVSLVELILFTLVIVAL
jgi:hypothetical protein